MAINKENYNYEVSTKTNVFSSGTNIVPDGFSSVICVNSGNDIAFINDNIPVFPKTTFEFRNRPDTVITEDFRIRFAGQEDAPQVAVMRVYYKKIK